MNNADNLERAKRIVSRWPEWKRTYALTKYSEQVRNEPPPERPAETSKQTPQVADHIEVA